MEKSIYTLATEDFDGNMPGCTGAECGHCCNNSNVTSLINDEISDYGGAEGLNRVGVDVQTTPQFYCGRLIGITHRIRNCLGANGCKITRPFVCKTFPFDMRPKRPLSFGCPHIIEIASNPATIRHILETRARLGAVTSNGEWYRNMQANIGALIGVRDKFGLSTAKHDEAIWLRVIKETLGRLQEED